MTQGDASGWAALQGRLDASDGHEPGSSRPPAQRTLTEPPARPAGTARSTGRQPVVRRRPTSLASHDTSSRRPGPSGWLLLSASSRRYAARPLPGATRSSCRGSGIPRSLIPSLLGHVQHVLEQHFDADLADPCLRPGIPAPDQHNCPTPAPRAAGDRIGTIGWRPASRASPGGLDPPRVEAWLRAGAIGSSSGRGRDPRPGWHCGERVGSRCQEWDLPRQLGARDDGRNRVRRQCLWAPRPVARPPRTGTAARRPNAIVRSWEGFRRFPVVSWWS